MTSGNEYNDTILAEYNINDGDGNSQVLRAVGSI